MTKTRTARKKMPDVPVADILAKPKRGGARPGAGRPSKQAVAKRVSYEVANQIAEGKRMLDMAGVELDPRATPLDVMVEAMRVAYKLGGAIHAAPFAKEAAPYIHAKIANIELRPVGSNPTPEGEIQRLGLEKFYVDFIDVEATEVPDEPAE
jgi:hypothetical protein